MNGDKLLLLIKEITTSFEGCNFTSVAFFSKNYNVANIEKNDAYFIIVFDQDGNILNRDELIKAREKHNL